MEIFIVKPNEAVAAPEIPSQRKSPVRLAQDVEVSMHTQTGTDAQRAESARPFGEGLELVARIEPPRPMRWSPLDEF